jgi:Na+-transporting NADH:ubiquinone oxidoreductase subunit NqrF
MRDRRIKGWRKHHRNRRARFFQASRTQREALYLVDLDALIAEADALEPRILCTLDRARLQDARLARALHLFDRAA